MRLRSPEEYAFRLHQLVANAWLWAVPPHVPAGSLHFLERYREILLILLPPIADSELRELAESILAHRVPLFNSVVNAGPEIEWRKDYWSGRSSGLDYFRFVPYLDASRVGDHKVIWELNRHQHLVALARAFLVFRDPRCLREITTQLASWREQNPFLRGVNWASTLEVAFRALSWVAILALLGDDLPTADREALRADLYRHGRYIEHNLSVYFAPNTHLLGEALALAALGRVMNRQNWEELGDRILDEQRSAQIRPDGGYFEQSTYYHVYAMDMYLLHAVLRGKEKSDSCVLDMANYLACVLGPQRKLAFLGDDDGGDLFWPYGPREDFGAQALARAERATGHAIPDKASALFTHTGTASFSDGDLFVLIDCGPFGPGGAGHSHSDTLGLVVRRGAEEILIDPGTFTYTGDLRQRDWFRGSASHSTVRIDEKDQADPVNPFRWENKPEVEILEWRAGELLIAECRSRGFTHRREFRFRSSLQIVDDVQGLAGEHQIEQFWQTAEPPVSDGAGNFAIGSALLRIEGAQEIDVIQAERSTCYGDKRPSYSIRARVTGRLPAKLTAAITFRKS